MKKLIQNKTAKTLCVLALVTIFSFSSIEKTLAWDAMPAAIAKQMMEEASRALRGVQLASAKQIAYQTLMNEMNSLVGGSGSSGAMFITNWNDYLVKQPQANTTKYMNDYLTQITQGRASSRYKSVVEGTSSVPFTQFEDLANNKFEGFGGRNAYEFAMVKSAKADFASGDVAADSGLSAPQYLYQIGEKTINPEEPKITYTGDPRNVDIWNLNQVIGLGWSFQVAMATKAARTLEEEKRAAEVEAITNQGFKSKKTQTNFSASGSAGVGMGISDTYSTSQVTTPGIVIKENLVNTQNMGRNIVANAQSIPEVLTSVVSQVITRSLQQGIGMVQTQIQRQISNVQSQIGNQVQKAVGNIGPKGYFGN